MNRLRRLFPPVQTGRCASCAIVLMERRRRPCPVCGDMARIIERGMDMGGLAVRDRMG